VTDNRIFTVPNLVTFTRLIGVGVFWWVLLVQEDIVLAAWFIFAIGWTDWIDGYLARRLNQVSKLGKTLDPVADRLLIFSALVGGLIVDVIPPVIGYLLLARELLMAVVALVLVSKSLGTLEVRYLGKLATFLIYGSIPAFYLAAAGVFPELMAPAAWISGVVGLVLYWYTAFLYIGDARRLMAGLESRQP
jgi:cardiolipin synthase (CMP-forming)